MEISSGRSPHRMQLFTVGPPPPLYIPPPPMGGLAVLPLNVQLFTVGLLLLVLYIPPPPMGGLAVLPLNVQFVTVGLPLKSLNIPPSSLLSPEPFAFPPVILNPSITAVSSVPVPLVTWKLLSVLLVKLTSSSSRSPLRVVSCCCVGH